METRASHILVGAFTLATVIAGFLFVVVIGKVQFDRAYAYYDIMFDQAVAGLSREGEVRYNGILVGEVKRIWVKPETPDKVWVRVRIERREDIVIRQDSVASLEYQGVTGVSYIQISGGSAQSPALPVVTDEDDDAPVIASRASALQAVFATAPSLLAQAERLLIEAQALFSPENRESLSAILANVSTLTGTVAGQSENIETAIANVTEISSAVSEMADEVAGLAANLNRLSGRADEILDEDVAGLVTQAEATVKSYEVLASDVSRLIRNNEEGINTFADQGLAQLAFFLTEARQLVATLDRIAQRLEADAPSFIFGVTRAQEIEAGRD